MQNRKDMQIEINDGVASIYTPYSPIFVKKIKRISGATWVRDKSCWTIPEFAVDAVREIMTDVYGYNDSEANETITLRVTFNEKASVSNGDVVLFGKVLAHARGRDTGAKVGDDVAFIEGYPTSGGSARYWASEVDDGSVVILTGVNKNLYEREKDNLPYDVDVEVLETKPDRAKLLEEKERLLKRISEINELLDKQ